MSAGTGVTPLRSPGRRIASPLYSNTSARTPLPPQRRVDRYGFYVEEEDEAQEGFRASYTAGDPHHPHPARRYRMSPARIRLENIRTRKWLTMLDNWPVWKTKKEKRLRRRIRKGVPDALRGRVWMLVAEANVLKDEHPGLYPHLLTQTPKPADLQCIMLDLPRTMPNHYLFSTSESTSSPLSPASSLVSDADLPAGQRSLKNVLSSYAVYDPAVGYCQGMAFCASLLLCYMPEEDVFFMLHVLMRSPRYSLAGMYSPGLPLFTEVLHIFGQLANKHVPKLVAHMAELGIDHTMYASQWFMTLFTYNLPFDMVTRIWDMFLYEGWKAIYRVAIALLRLNERDLLKLDFDSVIERLKSLAVIVPAEDIVKAALAVPLSTKQVERMHSEYYLKHQHEIRARVDAAIADAERSERYRAAAQREAEEAADATIGLPSTGTAAHTATATGTGMAASNRMLVAIQATVEDEASDEDIGIEIEPPSPILLATPAKGAGAVAYNSPSARKLDPLSKLVHTVGVSLVSPTLSEPILVVPARLNPDSGARAASANAAAALQDSDPSKDDSEEEVLPPGHLTFAHDSAGPDRRASNLSASSSHQRIVACRSESSNSVMGSGWDRRGSNGSAQRSVSSAHSASFTSGTMSGAAARARAMDAYLGLDTIMRRSPGDQSRGLSARGTAKVPPAVAAPAPVDPFGLLSKASVNAFKIDVDRVARPPSRSSAPEKIAFTAPSKPKAARARHAASHVPANVSVKLKRHGTAPPGNISKEPPAKQESTSMNESTVEAFTAKSLVPLVEGAGAIASFSTASTASSDAPHAHSSEGHVRGSSDTLSKVALAYAQEPDSDEMVAALS